MNELKPNVYEAVFEEKFELPIFQLNIYFRSSPKFYPVRALWDTGANTTCISNNFMNEKKIEPISKIKASVETISPEEYVPVFGNFSILFRGTPKDFYIPIDKAIGDSRCDNNALDFNMVIGMDTIMKGDFAFSHHEGKTYFSFRYPTLGEHIKL